MSGNQVVAIIDIMWMIFHSTYKLDVYFQMILQFINLGYFGIYEKQLAMLSWFNNALINGKGAINAN